MADASIDVVFKTPGLAKADRSLGGLEKKAKKLEATEKKVGKTEKKLANEFIKNESKKKQAIQKTADARKKAATQAKAERRTRTQQIFQAIAKTGGASGAALGAAGEGVGVGGGIGVLGAVAGAAALGLVALNAAALRATESVTRVFEFGKALKETTKGLKAERRARGLAFGQAQGASILKLASRFNEKEFRSIEASVRRTGDAGGFGAIARAKETGLVDRVGLKPLLKLLEQGARIGQRSDEVIGRLASLSPGQLAARSQQDSLTEKALGFKSARELRGAVIGTTDSGVGAVRIASEQRILERDQFRQNENFFLDDRGNAQLRLDTNKLVDIEATAAVMQEKQMRESIELQQRIADAQPFLLQGIQELGSLVGISESEQQKAARIAADQNISRGTR